MPGAWKFAHITEVALGLLHLSSPGGGGHSSCPENGDHVALFFGEALYETFPWHSGCGLQVHSADAFGVQPTAGGLG